MSLVEIMVVMVIIGIITGLGAYAVNQGPRVEDEGRRLANLITEGVRQAIAGGPVDPMFLTLTGMDGRVEMQFTYDAVGNQVMILGLLGNPPNWALPNPYEEINRKYLDEDIEIVGFTNAAMTTPGSAPANAMVPGVGAILYARPDGSCFAMDPFSGIRSDALTLYLRHKHKPQERARVVIMPLGGQSLVLNDW